METEQLVTSNGHTISAFKDDFITRRIRKYGLYEKPTLDFLRGYLATIDHPVIADIGANIGNHTLDFSTYAERVYSFEPVKFTYDTLCSNVHQNGLSNVTPVNLALSDRSGCAEINIVADNIGASGFGDRGDTSQCVQVEMRRGDDVFAELDLPRLDFIKIDVEGHEESVLGGLTKTIKKYRPIIMMEWCVPDAIRSMVESQFLSTLESDYEFKVLGSNRDRAYWEGKPLAWLRRKVGKLLLPRSAVLYRFEPARKYDNILLIPRPGAARS